MPSNTPETQAILPCLKCGTVCGPAGYEEPEQYLIGCGCWSGFFPTREEAIAAWNTRAPLPATQEDAERSGVGVFDIEPNLTASSPEPSLRSIVFSYYDAHFDAARARELTNQYFAALSTPAMSDLQRQEYDGEAVREADEHYTVAMDRRPKEIGGVKVGPGLYRIHWKDGGSSLAAIGMCRNGAWWVAPTNWTEPAVAFRIDEDPEGRWSWAGVKALDRLDPAALAHPAQAPAQEGDLLDEIARLREDVARLEMERALSPAQTVDETERIREARHLLQYARPLVGIARSMSDGGTADSARLLCQRIDEFLSDSRVSLSSDKGEER